MHQKRQLSVIMFTDIVGYTAIMQKDESLALKTVNQYRQILKSKVQKYNGNVIKYLGDGSLTIFDSVVHAVKCAHEFQLHLKDESQFLIRIGIHTGEVIFGEDDIYGDGINIASRLHDIANGGSVLFTKDIYDKIHNHPELECLYLGKHSFKNISEKLDVYALSNPGIEIPSNLNITDKEDENSDFISGRLKLKLSSRVILYSITTIIALLAFILIVTQITSKNSNSNLTDRVNKIKSEYSRLENVISNETWNIYLEIYELRNIVHNNDELDKIWFNITNPITISTQPEGSSIYIKPYSNPDTAWIRIGDTPLSDFPFPKGLTRIKIESKAYNTQFDIILCGYYNMESGYSINYKLFTEEEAPPDMVYAPESPPDWLATPGLYLKYIGEFWIDKFEVTNEEFKEFVDAGGYQNPSFWEESFLIEKDTLSYKQAITKFKDRTGWNAPANWELGEFLPGTDNLPVTGVSWYEAAAYAKFRKKSLPTLHHWLYASVSHAAQEIVKYGNFNQTGPAEVGRYNSMTRFGTFDLPGNVSEWMFNENLGKKYIMGGNYKEPNYLYNSTFMQLYPWIRSELVGFRCIKLINDTLQAELFENFDLARRDYANLNPVSDRTFELFQDLIPKRKISLEPETESIIEESIAIRENITINVPYESGRMMVFVFLPKGVSPPYQPIIFFPGMEAHYSNTASDQKLDQRIDWILKLGRAVIWPRYYSSYGRGENNFSTEKWIQAYQNIINDIIVTCDYLHLRDDMDTSRIGYHGISWGGGVAPYILVNEKRIKTGILALFGVSSMEKYRFKQFDQVDYLPRVKIPMLLLGGKYDHDFTLEEQQAFYDLLGTPEKEKKWVTTESTHWIPRDELINESRTWFDKYLGPLGE